MAQSTGASASSLSPLCCASSIIDHGSPKHSFLSQAWACPFLSLHKPRGDLSQSHTLSDGSGQGQTCTVPCWWAASAFWTIPKKLGQHQGQFSCKNGASTVHLQGGKKKNLNKNKPKTTNQKDLFRPLNCSFYTANFLLLFLFFFFFFPSAFIQGCSCCLRNGSPLCSVDLSTCLKISTNRTAHKISTLKRWDHFTRAVCFLLYWGIYSGCWPL